MTKQITDYYRLKIGETGWDLEVFTQFQTTTELYNELSKDKRIIQIIMMDNTLLIKTKDNIDVYDDVNKILEKYVRLHKAEIDSYEEYVEKDILDVIDEFIVKFIAFCKRIINRYK